MVYPISVSRLRVYQRCAYSYYLRYEKRVNTPEFYGSAALGNALGRALAQCYGDWHYGEAVPDRRWLYRCWNERSKDLSLQQVREGRAILDVYYDRYINSESVLRRPLAVEGKLQAVLEVKNLEFQIVGRYDRIDPVVNGLEWIDYKAAKLVQLPSAADLDLQMGLYALAVEQCYEQRLRYMSLLLLRTGEKVRYRVTQRHRQLAKQMITQLAQRLRQEESWQPNPGSHCGECSFSRYCSAVSCEPNPLPPDAAAAPNLQLTFGLAS